MPENRSRYTAVFDAKTLLKIADPETGHNTCVGYAPSKGRRCHNPIAYHNRLAAEDVLRSLPLSEYNREALRDRLEEAAELYLCRRYHQNQASNVAKSWYRKITKELDKAGSRPPSSRNSCLGRNSPTCSSVASIPISTRNSCSHAKSLKEIRSDPERSSKEDSLEHADCDRTADEPEDELQLCSICYNEYVDPYRTPCGHTFCWVCISTWLADDEKDRDGKHKFCPMDRRPLRVVELVPASTGVVMSEDEKVSDELTGRLMATGDMVLKSS